MKNPASSPPSGERPILSFPLPLAGGEGEGEGVAPVLGASPKSDELSAAASPLGMGPAVTIVSYDARWPALFQEEKPLVIEALGSLALALEHVGSTAVPGLAAKPILDLMLGVRQLSDATACIPTLQALGYAHEPEFEREIPEGRYFKKGPRGARTYHLHATELGGSFWERHLLFRDWLRTHPEDARAYERLKRELATRFASDRLGYTNAKTDFIEAAVEKARAAATIPST